MPGNGGRVEYVLCWLVGQSERGFVSLGNLWPTSISLIAVTCSMRLGSMSLLGPRRCWYTERRTPSTTALAKTRHKFRMLLHNATGELSLGHKDDDDDRGTQLGRFPFCRRSHTVSEEHRCVKARQRVCEMFLNGDMPEPPAHVRSCDQSEIRSKYQLPHTHSRPSGGAKRAKFQRPVSLHAISPRTNSSFATDDDTAYEMEV